MSADITTVHGRMHEHMQLARRWLEFNGRRINEAAILRVMSRYEPADLRRALASIDRGSKAP